MEFCFFSYFPNKNALKIIPDEIFFLEKQKVSCYIKAGRRLMLLPVSFNYSYVYAI